jgi:hypothetical protein
VAKKSNLIQYITPKTKKGYLPHCQEFESGLGLQRCGMHSSANKQQQGEIKMATNVHSSAELGKILMWLAGIVAFVIVMLTLVPDWISPEGTNGTGNRGNMSTQGVGSTARMIN